MLPLWIALQFLSSLPIRLPGMPEPQQLGRSLLFYPLVGLLFGLILYALNLLLVGAPMLLHAALLLTVWVLLSGALHLDGLADSADAWLGGFGDRERTLTIMKDPCSGPIAVVTLVLVLLLKFAALLALIEQGHTLALIIVPVLGRAALLGLFLTTPYVRAGGLGQALADHLPRKAGVVGAGVECAGLRVDRGYRRGADFAGWVCLAAAIDDAAVGRGYRGYGRGVAGIAGDGGVGGARFGLKDLRR